MGMRYDDAAAERLEAVYLGPDVVAQRDDTLRRLAIQTDERVLDIGSGPGFLATQRITQDWLSYRTADAADLPFEDGAFDVVVSTQVAEYVPDIAQFCREVHRVLKPGAAR
ncbi:methyltransferase domain-containing protein [Primorskyibacter sp. S187A]|uniref:methyltransferase domain-containing protein n=1 Tax=Primorskyibacter sp. S187A TaxID=3415130 RepID=UPI003C7C0C9A